MPSPEAGAVLAAATGAQGALQRLRDRLKDIPQPGSLPAARSAAGSIEKTTRSFAGVLRAEAVLAGAALHPAGPAAADRTREAFQAAARSADDAAAHVGSALRNAEALTAGNTARLPARVARLAREAEDSMAALAAAFTGPSRQPQPGRVSSPGPAGRHRQISGALWWSADLTGDICTALAGQDVLAQSQAPAARAAAAEFTRAGTMLVRASQQLRPADEALAAGISGTRTTAAAAGRRPGQGEGRRRTC